MAELRWGICSLKKCQCGQFAFRLSVSYGTLALRSLLIHPPPSYHCLPNIQLGPSGGFRNFQRGVQATKGNEAVHSRGVWEHAPPGKFCNFNAPKVEFEASGTYFSSICSHSSCTLMQHFNEFMQQGAGLTILVCII